MLLSAIHTATYHWGGGTLTGILLQTNNNSWLSPARLQIGRSDSSSYTDRSCIGTTDGNLHIDCYSGKGTYLNYFCNAKIYFNGSTYCISADGSYYNGTAASANSAPNYLPLAGGTLTGALTIQGVSQTGAYSQGAFNQNYSNIMLKGDPTYGVSGITFLSYAGTANINHPSDVAFIQYHPHGVTPAAYNTTPTEASSGERSRLVIGIGNDADEGSSSVGEQLWLQTSGYRDLIHYVVNTPYMILDTYNYTDVTVSKTGTGASGTWGINISGNAATATTATSANSVAWGNVTGKPSTYAPSSHEHNEIIPAVESSSTVDDFIGFSNFRYSKRIVDGTPNLFTHESGNNANTVIYIPTSYTGWGTQLGFNGNADMFLRAYQQTTPGSWKTVIHSGNIGSQSVNYATSAGSATSATKLANARTLWGQSFDGQANVNGTVYINSAGAGSFDEGMRIKPHSNGWATILLGGTDLSSNTGTSTNSWSIHSYSGYLYINKNASSQQQSTRLWGHNNGYTIGNTNVSSYALNVGGTTYSSSDIIAGGDIRASGNDIYAGSASGSQCHMQYDSSNECMKFLFD